MFRRFLLASALLMAPSALPILTHTAFAQSSTASTPEETIAALTRENRALKAENARLKTMLRRAQANRSPVMPVFATHEFAARGSIFISDGTGSIYQQSFLNSLVQQDFEPKTIFDNGKTLEAGTRVRSLKMEKIEGENNPDWAHLVVVVDGPNRGTRGWCADSILIQATN